jgi:predicted Zn-dependent peptidase
MQTKTEMVSHGPGIQYERFVLENGLTVYLHTDRSTPMVAVNVLYRVGARDESPDRTGFAHLFEHLMFSGSVHAPDYDEPIQRAGGDNNAFTNTDITNFYVLLPAENLETALWLESDRMLQLNLSQRALDIQRKVVVEEFKETCLEQPYGDLWHQIGPLAYRVHPYQWPTIGKDFGHIENARLADVRDFYHRFYHPGNADLVIAGNIDTAAARRLVEKWFADIPAGPRVERSLPQEPPQTKLRTKRVVTDVPNPALYLAFHMPARLDRDFHAIDLLTDLLAGGRSARFHQHLIREKELFESIDCYVTGTFDPGLLIIEANPGEGVSIDTARDAIWTELRRMQDRPVGRRELQKVKNKAESALLFSEMSVLNKAINLAYYAALDVPEWINEESAFYQTVTAQEIQQQARRVLREDNCSELVYWPEEA